MRHLEETRSGRVRLRIGLMLAILFRMVNERERSGNCLTTTESPGRTASPLVSRIWNHWPSNEMVKSFCTTLDSMRHSVCGRRSNSRLERERCASGASLGSTPYLREYEAM